MIVHTRLIQCHFNYNHLRIVYLDTYYMLVVLVGFNFLVFTVIL